MCMRARGCVLKLLLYGTPSVSFYLSLDSVILHYQTTNKKKRREYDFTVLVFWANSSTIYDPISLWFHDLQSWH
jgi:hypothetical protein